MPIVFVAAIDGDWEVASSAAKVLQELCGFRASDPSTPWRMISGPGVQEVSLPPDGNCLFGSLALGRLLLEDSLHQVPIGHGGVSLTMEQRGDLGADCRHVFLKEGAETHESGHMWNNLDLGTALDISRSWPSVQEYLATMRSPITCPRQWAAFAEAVLISYDWRIAVAMICQTL